MVLVAKKEQAQGHLSTTLSFDTNLREYRAARPEPARSLRKRPSPVWVDALVLERRVVSIPVGRPPVLEHFACLVVVHNVEQAISVIDRYLATFGPPLPQKRAGVGEHRLPLVPEAARERLPV